MRRALAKWGRGCSVSICLTLEDVFCAPSVRRCNSSTPMLRHWPSFLPLCCVIKCCSDIYSWHADICIPSLPFPSNWLRLVFPINPIICAVIFVKPTALSERLLLSAVVSYTHLCTAACEREARWMWATMNNSNNNNNNYKKLYICSTEIILCVYCDVIYTRSHARSLLEHAHLRSEPRRKWHHSTSIIWSSSICFITFMYYLQSMHFGISYKPLTNYKNANDFVHPSMSPFVTWQGIRKRSTFAPEATPTEISHVFALTWIMHVFLWDIRINREPIGWFKNCPLVWKCPLFCCSAETYPASTSNIWIYP